MSIISFNCSNTYPRYQLISQSLRKISYFNSRNSRFLQSIERNSNYCLLFFTICCYAHTDYLRKTFCGKVIEIIVFDCYYDHHWPGTTYIIHLTIFILLTY